MWAVDGPGGTLPNWWTRLSAEHRRLGTQVEKVSLLQTEVKGCLGCNACRYGKPCVQKDGFQGVADKILAADLIAFASPLYFWTISSRLKALIERFYAIAQKDPQPTPRPLREVPGQRLRPADDCSGQLFLDL